MTTTIANNAINTRCMIYFKCAALLICCAMMGLQQAMPSDWVGLVSSSKAKTNEVVSTRETSDRKKPNLIFYVGLPKTATSFMQCTLCAISTKQSPFCFATNTCSSELARTIPADWKSFRQTCCHTISHHFSLTETLQEREWGPSYTARVDNTG